MAWGFNYPKFGRKFLCGFSLFACLLAYSTATFLAALKAFPSLTPSSGMYRVGKYSTDCMRATVPLVVATWSVAMDISSHPDDQFPPPPTLRHQLLSISFVEELN